MANVIDYMARAKDQPFSALPFYEIDNIALSQIVYLPLGEGFALSGALPFGQAVSPLLNMEADKIYEILLRNRLILLRLMASGSRYADLTLSHHVDELSEQDQKQFCAVTLTLPNGTRVISFRGTDLSLVGWKEDMNMTFQSPVPAQERALEYLNAVAGEGGEPLVLLGHSKGGNLAVYAASHCAPEIRRRIVTVYSNDGPGLMASDVASAGYKELGARLVSFLPQGTMVGILFHQHRPYRVVRSNGLGPFQHDPFSWQVDVAGARFEQGKALTRGSMLLGDSFNSWLSGISMADRQRFVEALYQVLTAGGSKTLGELVRSDLNASMRMLRASMDLPEDVKKLMRRLILGLFSGTWDHIKTMIGGAIQSALEAPGEKKQLPPSRDQSGQCDATEDTEDIEDTESTEETDA